jgi:hypothetical protein
MPHFRYKLKYAFTHNNHVKSEEVDFGINFMTTQFQREHVSNMIINIFRQTGSLMDKKEWKQNAECSMRKNEIKSVIKNPLDILHGHL